MFRSAFRNQFRANFARPAAKRFYSSPAADKKKGLGIPVELTPLFLAMGIAVCSAIYFSSKKFLFDDSLRVGRSNPELSGLEKVLEEHKDE